MRIRLSLFALILASALATAQSGLVATDYSGRVVLFQSSARLAGEAPDLSLRILQLADGTLSVLAASTLPPTAGGVAVPLTNDSGELRGYSYFTRPVIRPGPPTYTGVVRNARDGWETRRSGHAALSRDGRWVVFSPDQLRIDLWNGEETRLSQARGNITSIADDGTVVSLEPEALLVDRPGAAPIAVPLPFSPLAAIIDRTGTFAAVTSSIGDLWRADLTARTTELWVPRCSNCQTLGIAAEGRALLYQEWSWIMLVREPGSGAVRLSREGLVVDSAAFTGNERSVVAATADGITRFNLETLAEELVLPGATSFTRQPLVIAPGMWVRQEGRGLAAAEINLNGMPVPSARRSSADIVWTVPADTPLGPAQLEIAQPVSPFQPNTRSIDIQRAAPFFVTEADAGIGNSATLDWPVIRHADTGLPVLGLDPARPGESITVLMTGLNDQASAIDWTLALLDTPPVYRLRFESTEPHPDNPGWTIVRLRMPDTLPWGISVLSAGYEKVQNNVLLSTSDR